MASAFPGEIGLGTVIDGRYEVIRALGRGGMGAVYEVEQIKLRKRLALKVLAAHRIATDEDDSEPSDSNNGDSSLRRFLREARAASSIKHRNVVDILDFGDLDGGSAYYVMELLSGRNLSKLIKSDGVLSWARTRRLLRQILGALTAAHQRGIIHRDVKPANIMLLDEPDEWGNEWIKVLDFGIAKVEETDHEAQALTGTSELLGTAAYMGPDAARGEPATQATDLYAVGVMAYELLTGTVPFRGANTFQVLLRHINERPLRPSEINAAITPDIEAFILRALAKDPEDRYESAAQMAEVLEAIDDDGVLADNGTRRLAALIHQPLPDPSPTGGESLTAGGRPLSESEITDVGDEPGSEEGGRTVVLEAGAATAARPRKGSGVFIAACAAVLGVLGAAWWGSQSSAADSPESEPKGAISVVSPSEPSPPAVPSSSGVGDDGSTAAGDSEGAESPESTTTGLLAEPGDAESESGAGEPAADEPAAEPKAATNGARARCTSIKCRRRNAARRLKSTISKRCGSLAKGETVELRFTIGTEGEVLMPRVIGAHAGSAAGKCALQRLEAQSFPPSDELKQMTLKVKL